MARSRKKNPYVPFAQGADSEKQDKRRANRRLRNSNNQILAAATVAETPEEIEEITDGLKTLRESSQVFSFAKDGKQRVNPDQHPRSVRK